MGDRTAIEWTDATWNPVRGCTKVSAGCDNCYAMTVAHRFSSEGQPYEGLTRVIGGRGQWNGKVMLVEQMLDQPLRWRKPRRIFVNSMSDLFHPEVPDEFIDRVFAVMILSPQHTFQVLTKRPQRMREYLSDPTRRDSIRSTERAMTGMGMPWPLPNVWLGVSVEDQATAEQRIPLLLQTPSAVRWASCEPLLGAVDLANMQGAFWLYDDDYGSSVRERAPGIDWVVVGGESGPSSRPMHPDWARSLRDQCQVAGVPFLFKQWGDWRPIGQFPDLATHGIFQDGTFHKAGDLMCGMQQGPDGEQWSMISRAGKHKAGRLLDGETWDQYPASQPG